MSGTDSNPQKSLATYYVDEAGDGVLFGPMGRNRLDDPDAPRFFMLGMVRCTSDSDAETTLGQLRQALQANPLYASISSMQTVEGKTARAFYAKDDHPEIRAKVFETLLNIDFKFFAVIKDMRAVLKYVEGRNRMNATYRYHPNELYDLTVRMLFKNKLHTQDRYRITFARRGKSDRTKALRDQLEVARAAFLKQHPQTSESEIEIIPAYPWESPCLQIADYCVWALQRCYERQEARFLHAIWSKVSLVHDADDTRLVAYGNYLNREKEPPKPEEIKNRRI